MHDLDRTQAEYGEAQEFAGEQFEYPGETEVFGEALGEAFEMGLQGETYESQSAETTYEREAPLSESEEVELASELLEITNEAELDQFLGNLVRRAASGIGRIVSSPVGKALGGVLKSAARKALPIVGKAVGTYFGGATGGQVGGQLASTAGRLFGLELEGLSSEDAQYEVARRYVRFATAAARRAATLPPRLRPQSVARSAVVAAARRFAPGLLRPGVLPQIAAYSGGITGGPTTESVDAGGTVSTVGFGRRGSWYRRGRKIVLVGA
jgi:hypothetical protein